MRIETHTILAYAKSKKISVSEAFRECFEGIEYGRAGNGLLPSEGARVADDYRVYQTKGVIPKYVLRWLEEVRSRQLTAEQPTFI